MVTIEALDLDIMRLGRKGALLMLMVAVLWTAIPAFACLLGEQPTVQPACCRGMVRGCCNSKNASRSCCQVQGHNAAVAPALPYSPEHPQKLALGSHQPGLQPLTSSDARYGNTFEAPPPKFPPGGASILRI